MHKQEVKYIDLPITTDSKNDLLDLEDDPDNLDVQNRGDVVRIVLLVEEQMERAGVKKPRIGTLEELKVVFVLYLKEQKLQLLDCQVEKYLESRGHQVLWEPPYCPEL